MAIVKLSSWRIAEGFDERFQKSCRLFFSHWSARDLQLRDNTKNYIAKDPKPIAQCRVLRLGALGGLQPTLEHGCAQRISEGDTTNTKLKISKSELKKF